MKGNAVEQFETTSLDEPIRRAGVPVYVVTSENLLSNDAARHVMEHIRRAVDGSVLGDAKFLLLHGGLRIRPLSPDAESIPVAADVLEQHGFQSLADWLRDSI